MASTDQKLVTIFRTTDPVVASLAVSFLDHEKIPFIAKNLDVQNPIGCGTLGPGFNNQTGPIEIEVAEPYVQLAMTVLEDVRHRDGRTVSHDDGRIRRSNLPSHIGFFSISPSGSSRCCAIRM